MYVSHAPRPFDDGLSLRSTVRIYASVSGRGLEIRGFAFLQPGRLRLPDTGQEVEGELLVEEREESSTGRYIID